MNSKTITQFMLGVIAATALLTGSMETIIGIPVQSLFGAELPEAVLYEPVFMSQFRFTSLMWFMYGIFMILFIRDMKRYSVMINLTLGAVLVAGLTRIGTYIQCGAPTTAWGRTYIMSMLIMEVSGPILTLYLFSRAKNKGLV